MVDVLPSTSQMKTYSQIADTFYHFGGRNVLLYLLHRTLVSTELRISKIKYAIK